MLDTSRSEELDALIRAARELQDELTGELHSKVVYGGS